MPLEADMPVPYETRQFENFQKKESIPMIKRVSFMGAILALALVASLVVGPVMGQSDTAVPKNLREYSERATEAGKVLQEVMGIPEDGIPDELMARARAVAVIPHVIKGAFGIGGRFGKGLVSQRMPNGRWSPPA